MNTDYNETIYSHFHKYVSERPNAIAVTDPTRRLSFKELDDLASAIAAQIPAMAKMVGILMDHTVETVASMLAIIKCGAAYIPLEPDLPQERILFILCECGADAVITQHKYAHLTECFNQIFIEQGTEATPDSFKMAACTRNNDIACVLYTSEATGLPKGVMIENRNICHAVSAFRHEFHPKATDRIIQIAAINSSLSLNELFPALMSGFGIVIPNKDTANDINRLARFIGENSVTIIIASAEIINGLNSLNHIPSSLRLIISHNIPLRYSDISRLITQAYVYNSYGHVETAACAAFYRCNGSQTLSNGYFPIGRAARGTAIVLIDNELNQISKDGIGEICVVGGNVARGYIRSRKNGPFINLVCGDKLYCTGDIGQRLNDGSIAYIRSKDSHVMIMGQRIEPGEIESIICSCNCIEDCVVKPITGKDGKTFLAAYIVPRNRLRFKLNAMKETISRFLPPYMIPEHFIKLRRMPVTATGEVNFAALPPVY